jgi:hypothetical protein
MIRCAVFESRQTEPRNAVEPGGKIRSIENFILSRDSRHRYGLNFGAPRGCGRSMNPILAVPNSGY